MSSASVIDQLGVFFGGAYQPTNRYYGTPQVPGLGAVRRGKPKDANTGEWFLGMPAGAASGAVMVVRSAGGAEKRVASAGPVDGGKKVAHSIQLVCYIRSNEEAAEDVEDFTGGLLEAIRDRIHADRTCGSGGLEVGGFQVGEDYDGPGSDLIEWDISEVVTTAGVSKQTLLIEFSASEYIQA